MFPQNIKNGLSSSNSNGKQHGDTEKGDCHQGIRQCDQNPEGRGHLLCTPVRVAQTLVDITTETGAKELVLSFSPLLLDDCACILASHKMSVPKSLELVNITLYGKRDCICG